jgi:serine/threonine protein kinase
MRPWRIDDFEILSLIHTSDTSDVFRVVEKDSGVVYAIKRLSKCLIIKNHECKQVERELNVHQNLNHQHIIRFQAWFHDLSHIFIVTEFAALNAADLLRAKYTDGIPERIVQPLFDQCASAIKHIHSLNIIHRDIKPSNMFLARNDAGKLVLKLGDFGCSVHTNPHDLRRSIRGSVPYMAPELVLGMGHSFPVDMWSLGVSIHELLTNKLPFDGQSPMEIYRNILKQDYVPPSSCSKSLNDAISTLLFKDPQMRALNSS